MAPPDVRTTASTSGAASGDGYTLPPTRASVCAFAATLKQAATLKRKRESAARSRFPIMGGASNFAYRRLEALRKGARRTERYPISTTLL
jgi:hypothetical protein